MQGAPDTRLEQPGEATVAGQESREGDHDDGVGPVGLPADGPGGARLHREPATVPGQPGVGRYIDPRLRPGAVADPYIGVDETLRLDEPEALVRAVPIDAGVDAYALGPRFKYDRGRERIGSPPPQPHRARIARARRHVGTERRKQEQRVAVEPDDVALGFGEMKAVRHEVAGREVELAQHDGIGATARQVENGAVMRAGQRRGALEVQSSPSLAASASRSSRISQVGLSLRKLSGVHVRHKPRGCEASCQKLNTFPPLRVG